MSIAPNDYEESSLASVDYYLSVVAHKIQMLNMRVEKISQQDYTSPSPIALSEILVRILARFFDTLKLLSRKADYQTPEDIIRTARTINFAVEGIIPQLLEAIESANKDTPITSVIEAYENIVSQVRYGAKAIMYPKWEYNASFDEIMNILRRMTKSLDTQLNKAIFSGAPPFFAIITYPKAEESAILRQALMAHEIGHFISVALGWSDSIFENQLFSPDDYDNIIDFVAAQEIKDQKRIALDVVLLVEEAIVPWIQEIISDFLAVCALGPAYLIAFDEVIFLPDFPGDQKIYRSHPPEALRKHLMGNLIKDLYLDPILYTPIHEDLSEAEQNLFTNVYHWVNIISKNPDEEQFKTIQDLDNIPPDVIRLAYRIMRKSVEQALFIMRRDYYPEIKEEAWVCKLGDILDSLKLQELLAHGLTPTELYTTPARDPNFAAIMNSGWFYLIQNAERYLYFSKNKSMAINPDIVRADYINLQNLIAKSIESLMFKKEFNRRRGTIDG